MGTYCNLSIGHFEVFSSKNGVWEGQTAVFVPSDRVVWARTCRERLGYDEDEADDYLDSAALDEEEIAVAYRASARQCIARLTVRGETLQRAEARYEEARAEILAAFGRDREALASEGMTFEQLWTAPDRWSYDLETLFLEGTEDFYRTLDFSKWLEELRVHVAEYGTTTEDRGGDRNLPPANFQQYIARSGDNDRPFGFLGGDLYLLLRCLLEVVERETVVELDVSELILEGYLDANDEVVSSEPHFTILTEGKSDKWILERTLPILYPHLAPYYKFADFEASGLPGGTSHNVHIVRAYIALSIRDRLIVLFDNDAAGQQALKEIASVPIPPNVRAMALPDLDQARSWPTLGPGGPATNDVNGQAVSIEFFFGKDVLERDGSVPPVRWSSFQPRTGTYQGEIERKHELQAAYNKVLSDPRRFRDHDWSDMKKLFVAIFEQFM